ncbi:MAG: hypothetical protein O6746_02625 [Thaumarchaeota archaeon]|nr:hypothetical protein [Nitrososphaerota archaeon]
MLLIAQTRVYLISSVSKNMRIRLYGIILALGLILSLGTISLMNPVFADHYYLQWKIDHASTTFEDYEINYQNYGTQIKKVQADISDKKLIFNVFITATPVFLEISLPRDLLDARDNDSDGDFKIIYDGNRARVDEVYTSPSYRTLNIPLRGVGASENIELEIHGTHIFDEYPKQEPELEIEEVEAVEVEPELEIEEVEQKIDTKQGKKLKEKQGPKKMYEFELLLGPLQMFESKKIVKPELESKPKIEVRHIQETMQMIETKQKLSPELDPTPSIVKTSKEPTNILVEENLDELTPKLEQIPVANIENEIASTEDDCFICKNKIKENRKLKTQQQSEQVVPTKTEIEQLEDLDEEPNDEINFLNEILKQFQGLFQGMFSLLK